MFFNNFDFSTHPSVYVLDTFYQNSIQTVGTTRVVATMPRRLRIVSRRVRMIKRMVPITRMVTNPRMVTILSQDSLNYFEFC